MFEDPCLGYTIYLLLPRYLSRCHKITYLNITLPQRQTINGVGLQMLPQVKLTDCASFSLFEGTTPTLVLIYSAVRLNHLLKVFCKKFS